ncbi:MAG: transcriptional repressor NrdR [Thermoleophilia bacterium]|nr:transcriptional repressor NrdR [Thermoleophilia bacterium]
MNCPGCGGHNSKVLESRIADAGDAMRRRRECLDCNERFTTYERIEQPPLLVTKHDGRREPFSRAKLLRGLDIACSKRDIPAERLEVLVADVETSLRADCGRRGEVTSDRVGELALEGLVRIDEAAAIRFASVIERAESLAGFRQVLDRMAAAVLEGNTAAGADASMPATPTGDPCGDVGGPAVNGREPVAV